MPGIKTQNLNIFRRTPAPSFCLGVTVKSYLTQIIYLTDSAPGSPATARHAEPAVVQVIWGEKVPKYEQNE